MGRGRSGGRRNKWKKKGKGGGGWASGGHKTYSETIKENPSFEKYYKDQKIVPESEWAAFMASLRLPLGVTFRVNLLCPYRERIKKTLATELQFEGQVIKVDRQTIPPPFAVPWYPGNDVWQISTSKRNIRKSPLLRLLHKWLVREQTVGNISRQELVSMVPPLLLDPKPHDVVLDMCASPGSKTVQILEMMHSQEKASTRQKSPGMVVANDVDSRRAYLLVHQCKRIGTPALIVTCHAAQFFPRLRKGTTPPADAPPAKKAKLAPAAAAAAPSPKSKKTKKEKKAKKNKAKKSSKKRSLEEVTSIPPTPFLAYDRVLADVPCSGDGTLRKQPDIWKHWGIGHGNVLHPLQRSIAMRGAALLAIGGRMVYSTCALNPIEDEAVVASILRSCKGALELEDCDSMLPSLKRRKGLNSWLVADNKLNYYETFDSANAEEKSKHKLRPSMWPPTAEECGWMHLDRCMRFLPHDQDTGGFFVAVLRKVRDLPQGKKSRQRALAKANKTPPAAAAASSAEIKTEIETETETAKKTDFSYSKKKTEKKPKQNDPHGELNMYFPCPPKIWLGVRQFFGISEAFPIGQLFIRTSSAKAISYVSRPIADFCLNRDQRQRAALGHKQLKIVHTGLKIFEKQKNCEMCDYRVHQEGVSVILPFLTKRRIDCTPAEFLAVLKSRRNMKKGVSPMSILTPEAKAAVEGMCQGSLIFALTKDAVPAESGFTPNALAVAAWRGRASFSLMARKDDVSSIIEAVEAMVEPPKSALDATAKSQAMLQEKQAVAAVAAAEASASTS